MLNHPSVPRIVDSSIETRLNLNYLLCLIERKGSHSFFPSIMRERISTFRTCFIVLVHIHIINIDHSSLASEENFPGTGILLLGFPNAQIGE